MIGKLRNWLRNRVTPKPEPVSQEQSVTLALRPDGIREFIDLGEHVAGPYSLSKQVLDDAVAEVARRKAEERAETALETWEHMREHDPQTYVLNALAGEAPPMPMIRLAGVSLRRLGEAYARKEAGLPLTPYDAELIELRPGLSVAEINRQLRTLGKPSITSPTAPKALTESDIFDDDSFT